MRENISVTRGRQNLHRKMQQTSWTYVSVLHFKDIRRIRQKKQKVVVALDIIIMV